MASPRARTALAKRKAMTGCAACALAKLKPVVTDRRTGPA
jgi:hypothetical protein